MKKGYSVKRLEFVWISVRMYENIKITHSNALFIEVASFDFIKSDSECIIFLFSYFLTNIQTDLKFRVMKEIRGWIWISSKRENKEYLI